MANENPNQLAIEANLGVAQPNIAVVNENARLMGEYMVPPVVESQSSIVYPTFGQCPQHRLQKWLQVQYFYIGLNPISRANIDSACDGSITKRTADQVYQIMEDLVFTSALWPTERTRGKKVVRVFEVDSLTALLAQLASLAQKVDQMSVAQTVGPKCKHCEGNHESVDWQQHNPNPNTYYPDWRNHPGFQWSNNQGAHIAPQQTAPPEFQQNEKKTSLEDLVTKLAEMSTQHMQRTDKSLQVQGAAIKNLENQMGQIAKALSERQQVALSSNTEINPKQQVMVVKVVENEEVGTITTRNGIQFPEITVERRVKVNEKVPSIDEEQVDKSEQPDKIVSHQELENLQVKTIAHIKPHLPPVPFPQRLQKMKLEEQFARFLDIFKKLHVNIPLIEAISQIPNYAKFLKEILSKKKRLTDFKTIKLNEECSAILHNKLPPKLQDPGSLKIPCSIGNDSNFNYLCDSGANINLMPFSVYRELGLEELNDTSISLQLADRSIKYPGEVVENVLIKVGKFIFSIDFVVLDIEEP
ncbi:uncharacterized protein LOC111385219 [Olea europaea var. sylvestris]|uniref:uncharacterized protein LOC111385219 n=1 Tax=Olea europaea var. sylvestris TaxID=158386 RepID=UPI000C1CE0B7|nr:uncharacterized protein LOC111385219 [Olea europaea var. sylvestris]